MKVVDINNKISVEELKLMAAKMFGDMVKAVVDIEKGIMVVDAGMHADEEYELLENGSEQENLWGINFHPDQAGTDRFVVFDSMINLRPGQGNRSRGVDNPEIQKKIKAIVAKLVTL